MNNPRVGRYRRHQRAPLRVWCLRLALGLAITWALPRPALAHESAPPAPHDIWTAWTWDPVVLAAVPLAGITYAAGWRRLHRRDRPVRLLSGGQAACFWAGLAALTLALVSPLAALGSALFAAHMTQHLVLVLGAVPLLLIGRPAVAGLWALDTVHRRRLGQWWRSGWLTRSARALFAWPIIAWVLHAGTIWIWHFPAIYQAALTNETVHALEHLSFTLSAVAFWWLVLPGLGRPHLRRGGAILYLFAAAMQSTALGVWLTFSRVPWYPSYAATAPLWGLSPIADQQLAGLIMWIPAAVVYSLVAACLLVVWLGEENRLTGPRMDDLAAEAALEKRPEAG